MGVINNILMIILPFIGRTILIRQLGTEYVGLGSLFSSILQVLSLSDLGFGTAIGYLLYKPLADNNREKVNSILAFFRKVYRIVGFVILALSVCLLPFLDKLIAGDVPPDINIYILFLIYVANTVISYFFFAYKKILLSANQRYDVEIGIASAILIIQYCVQILVLLLFSNYYIYVLVIPFMTLIGNFVSLYFVNKLFPGYTCKGTLSHGEIKDVMKNTGGAFCSKIGSTVYLSADNVVISAFLGLTVLGIYNNYYYVISSLIALFAVVHNSIRPAIGNILVTENIEKTWNIYKKTNYLYMMSVIECCTCCFVLFQDFERIWAGQKNMLGIDIVFLLVICFFCGRLSCISEVFLEAAGILWQGKFIPLIAAIVNLVVNIILVQIIGLKGVVISSIIGYAFITLPGYTYVLFKYLFCDKAKEREYLSENGKIIFLFIVVPLVTWFSIKNIYVTGWIGLIGKGVITFCVSMILILLFNLKNIYVLETIHTIKHHKKK